jgi:tetratricopeptide (TPR) repeat protein
MSNHNPNQQSNNGLKKSQSNQTRKLLNSGLQAARNKQYSKAASHFRKAYNECPELLQHHHYYYFSKSLNELGNFVDSLRFAEKAYSLNPNDEMNNNLLGWNLFEMYIRNFHGNQKIEHDFLWAAKRVKEVCKQQEGSPLSVTVLIMMEYLADPKHSDYEDLLRWAKLLNPLELSHEPDLKIHTYAKQPYVAKFLSHAAKYYRHKSLALYELERFEECIMTIDEAIEELRNNLLQIRKELPFRKALALEALSECEEAIKILEPLYKKTHDVGVALKLFLFYIDLQKFEKVESYAVAILVRPDVDDNIKREVANKLKEIVS